MSYLICYQLLQPKELNVEVVKRVNGLAQTFLKNFFEKVKKVFWKKWINKDETSSESEM